MQPAQNVVRKGGEGERGGDDTILLRNIVSGGGLGLGGVSRPNSKNKTPFGGAPRGGAPRASYRELWERVSYSDARELERLWVHASQNIFGVRRRVMLYAERPTTAHGERVVRRLTDFFRLALSLQTWGANFPEFVTAVFEHHRRWCRRLPNVRQVAGEWGRGIWLRWREDRGQESLNPAARIEAASLAGTESRAERFVTGLRRAYADCRELGPAAVTLSWGAEILWAVAKTEPAMSPVVRDLLREAASDRARRELALAVAAEIRAISRNGGRQRTLLGLRRRATGAPSWRPLLGRESGGA